MHCIYRSKSHTTHNTQHTTHNTQHTTHNKHNTQHTLTSLHTTHPHTTTQAAAAGEPNKPNTPNPTNTASDSAQRQLAEKRASEGFFPIDMHQIVGLFSTDNDRSPPNLDCGLFSWSHFHNFDRPKTSTASNDATTNKGSRKSISSEGTRKSISSSDSKREGKNEGKKEEQKDRTWSYPNGKTSVATYRMDEFRMLLLGAPLSRERLSEVLPKKAQLWVGLSGRDN
jgi:hypothetical protein